MLARFLELPLTKKQLLRVKKLAPDGGDDIYLLIAPNWDGKDGLFDLKTLQDAPLLPNLEEISSFHPEPVTDCSPLVASKLPRRRYLTLPRRRRTLRVSPASPLRGTPE